MPGLQQAMSIFYSLIPHDCGFRRPPLIDSIIMLREKVKVLNAFAQLEGSSTLMRREVAPEENVLYKAFVAFDCQLTLLKRSVARFKPAEE